jgi:hypothetical protein
MLMKIIGGIDDQQERAMCYDRTVIPRSTSRLTTRPIASLIEFELSAVTRCMLVTVERFVIVDDFSAGRKAVRFLITDHCYMVRKRKKFAGRFRIRTEIADD